MLADPDVGAAASAPPLSDVRTLASGFHDLSATAAAPPPPPQAPPSPPAPVAAEPARPAAPRIYTSDDADVMPPTVVRQVLPPFPLTPTQASHGALAVVVDETGAVESAMMVVPINPAYDRTLLEAATTWRYRPATLNGAPVKFRRLVKINVVPR